MSYLNEPLATTDELKKQLVTANAAFMHQLADKDVEIAGLKKLDGPAERQLKAELLVQYTNLELKFERLKQVQLGCVDTVKAWVKKEIKEYRDMVPCTAIARGRSDIELIIEHNLERVSATALVHVQKQCDDAFRRDKENHELRKRAADFDRTLANRADDDKKNKIERDEAVRDKLIAEGQIRDLTWKLHTLGETKDAATKEVAELRDKVDENKELVHTAKVNKAAYKRLQNEVKKASESIEAARNQLAHTIDEGFDVPQPTHVELSPPAQRLRTFVQLFKNWSYDGEATLDTVGSEVYVGFRIRWCSWVGASRGDEILFSVRISADNEPGYLVRVERETDASVNMETLVNCPPSGVSTERAAAELHNVAADLIRGIANK